MKDWTDIFSILNQTLVHQPVGCCGMAGTYGHETRNRENSENIYNLSWKEAVGTEKTEQIITTGYSCRSQVKRLDQKILQHPLQYLLANAKIDS